MNGTKGTGTGPVPPGPLSVKDAAAYFGITERAVRKRIHVGTLMGEHIDGQWKVWPSARPQRGTGTEPEQFPRSTEQRNSSSGTDGAAQVAVVIQQMQAPLIERIGALERELGRTQEQRDRAAQEATELRYRAEQAERQLVEARASKSVPVAEASPPPPPSSPVPLPRSLAGQFARWVLRHVQ